MIMASLADVCNDKNKIAWEFSERLKAFCQKYQISPEDVEITYNFAGVGIKIKVG